MNLKNLRIFNKAKSEEEIKHDYYIGQKEVTKEDFTEKVENTEVVLKSDVDELVEKLQENLEEKLNKKEENKETWVWVDGYKGMKKDMTAYGRFQYEIGLRYVEERPIKECENGFHLCLDLKDVIGYYKIQDGNRFFKVKALVREKDVKNYGKKGYNSWIGWNKVDKIVAKEIIIEEELSDEELYETFKDIFSREVTFEDFKFIKEFNFDVFIENKLIEEVKESSGFSETFIMVLLSNLKYSSEKEYIVNFAKALKEQGVSTDMMVYLTLEEKKKLNTTK